jgi:TM2 domain-containing membrane protein YozV
LILELRQYMSQCQSCGFTISGNDQVCPACGRVNSPLEPINLFYSYSHQDEDLRRQLEAHLGALRRSGLIREWHDRKILPGEDWNKEISTYLESATLILLLLSADFINSNYIFAVEVKRALEKQLAGQAVVVPVILRPVMWQVIPELSRLQALPEGARPVTEWPSSDLAFVSVCEGILALVLSNASAARRRPELPTAGVGSFRPPRLTSRGRRRVLDAALPARVPVGKPSTLLVMIRRTDSSGLRGIVQAEPEYDIAAKDIESQPLTIGFPLDGNGKPQPADLSIKVECPQFQPASQIKHVKLSPRGDSDARVFLLTATQAGQLLVNLEVCRGDEVIAGCVLRSVGVTIAPGEEDVIAQQTIASASLPVSSIEDEPKPAERVFSPAQAAEYPAPQQAASPPPPPPPPVCYSPPSPPASTDYEVRQRYAGPPPTEARASGKSAILASLFSVIPGLGQLYNGDTKKAALMFFVFVGSLGLTSLTGFLLSFLPLLLVVWSMIDAYRVANGNGRRW